MSIRTKLIILFLASILIPTAVVVGMVYSNARDALEKQRLDQLSNIADLKKEKIETFFSELGKDLLQFQHYPKMKADLRLFEGLKGREQSPAWLAVKRRLDDRLMPLMKLYGYEDILLTDPSGTVVYAGRPGHFPLHVGKPLPDPEGRAFEEGRKGVFISDVFRNPLVDNRFTMLITAPLKDDADGSFLGVAALVIDMEPIYAFIQETTGLGETGETLVGKRDGDEMVFLNPLRHDPEAALKRKAIIGSGKALPLQRALLDKPGVGVLTDYRGVEVVSAWRYLPSLGWGLVAKIDAAEAFRPVTSLRRLATAIIVLALLAGALAAYAFASSITGPIERLIKGTEIMGAGDLGHRVGTDAADEVGRLSRAFDRMAENLKLTTASRDELDREVHERVRAENEAMRLNAELETQLIELDASNKELESFSYSVSHDLRAPLRAMDGFSQALLEDYTDKLDAQGKDYLNRVRAASQRMARLIDDMLKLSRVTRSEMRNERVDLSGLAREVAGSLKEGQPGRDVDFVIQDGLTATGDPRLLRQALENLLGNAWKFTARRERAKIEFGTAEREGRKVYFVRDDGAGFDMTYAGKLFGPFQRLHSDADFPGTGIGLATVQRIVHRHGGKVWAEGEPDKGATVYFTL